MLLNGAYPIPWYPYGFELSPEFRYIELLYAICHGYKFLVVIVLPIVTGYQNETYMNHLNNYEWFYLPFYTFQRIRKMEIGYLSPTKNTYN